MSPGLRKLSFVAQVMRRKAIAGLALCASMVALGLVIIPVAPAHAQTPLKYMVINTGTFVTAANPTLSSLSSGVSFVLPGYSSAQAVQVTWAAAPSSSFNNDLS